MTRAPFVVPKATSPFQRSAELADTTSGRRFVNPLMRAQYGVDSMPETAENVAEAYRVGRADQDAFALHSQERTVASAESGSYASEIVADETADAKGKPVTGIRDTIRPSTFCPH